ncbi:Uncharacterised protein [Salmonella enterica subsp. enterica]|nr:Uncharacterised protein [Salmonella enterica subsp. enterica]
MIQRSLAATTRDAIGLRGVLAVFNDVEVERPHFNGAEAHQALYHFMEVVSFVCLQNLLLRRFRAAHRPPVQHHHLFRFDHIGGRIEAIEVRQQEARGITDTTIAVGSAFQDFVRDRHFAGIVSRRHPQTQDIRAQFIHHILRRHGVTDGFGHLAPLTIDGEAVSQYLAVWRFAFHRHANHQGGHKPAAMLVRAFQIHIGRMTGEFRTCINHGVTGGTGIKPNVQRIRNFLVLIGIFAEDLFRVEIPPRLDTVNFDAFRHLFHRRQSTLNRQQLLRFFMHEQRHRYAPGTLT